MKITVKREVQVCLFEDIETGEVFYSETDPDRFLMRTDCGIYAAVDIETGVLYRSEEFDHHDPVYHIVNAEVTIF